MSKRRVRQDRVFISWAPFCSRSDSIIRHLGGTSYLVYSPFWGSNYATILLKYVSQSLKTLRTLFREKPRTVFVMTPPVIACVPVWLYAKLTGAHYIIDAHSGALINKRWQSTMFLHKFFSRHARTTIVTNAHLRDMVRGWGAHVTIVRDVPVFFADPSTKALDGEFNVTLINTFTPDEPLEVFLRAARQLPEMNFYVTGPLADADRQVVDGAPSNVKFTDYLPAGEYVGLLMACDGVVCLTTREHTMQRGAYESVYLERPVVVSNTELLREAFYKGSVLVENTVEGISAGLRQLKEHLPELRDQVRELRREKLGQWARTQAELETLIKTNGSLAR